MGSMLSLQDGGNIQQPMRIPNQRVAGDKQVLKMCREAPRPVQLPHKRREQSSTVQILSVGNLPNFQVLSQISNWFGVVFPLLLDCISASFICLGSCMR